MDYLLDSPTFRPPPGSLPRGNLHYAISAYVLGQAGITGTEPDTALDAETMAKVVMPNVDGFVVDPRLDDVGE